MLRRGPTHARSSQKGRAGAALRDGAEVRGRAGAMARVGATVDKLELRAAAASQPEPTRAAAMSSVVSYESLVHAVSGAVVSGRGGAAVSRVVRADVVGLERAAAALRLGYCGAVRRWAGAIAGLLGRAGGLI